MTLTMYRRLTQSCEWCGDDDPSSVVGTTLVLSTRKNSNGRVDFKLNSNKKQDELNGSFQYVNAHDLLSVIRLKLS